VDSTVIVLEATVTPEGALQFADRLPLPPGKVRITIEPLQNRPGLGVLEVLAQVHAAQAGRGFKGRTREEIDADVQVLRDEWEERREEVERLHGTKPAGKE
jgi:hypothetical protein